MKKCIKINSINNIYNMNPEEQKVLNQMYTNIQTLLKDVGELKTYKIQSEAAIRSLLQTNTELKDEITKLKSVQGSARTPFTQLPSSPAASSFAQPSLYGQTTPAKDLFRPADPMKKV